MKRLLNLLRVERSLIAGAFGTLSDLFGWDRAAARVAGFLILWGIPYCFGASIQRAWWISILIYIGFALIVRKRSCTARRRRDRLSAHLANLNKSPQRSEAAIHVPSGEKEAPFRSAAQTPAPNASEYDLVGQQFGDALSNLEQRLARLDQRIQQMESVVTDRSFDWDRRFRKP
jgi:hypothetical protein